MSVTEHPLFHVVRIEVECGQCQRSEAERLSNLIGNRLVECEHCGNAIDISGQDWRAFIDEVAQNVSKVTSKRP